MDFMEMLNAHLEESKKTSSSGGSSGGSTPNYVGVGHESFYKKSGFGNKDRGFSRSSSFNKDTLVSFDAPISQKVTSRMTVSRKKEEEEEKRSWFDKGLFDDGYDFGDISRTILGTTTDVLENVGSGIIGMGEKAIDAIAYTAPYAANAQFYQNGGVYNLELQKQHEQVVEQSKKDLGKFIAKDLYDEQAVARAIISDPARKIGINSDTQSVFGEKSDALIQSGGQLLATAGLAAAGMPWWLTTGATSFGSEAENAMNQGATYEQAGASAAISAGAEILSEKLSGGISFGGKSLDDALTKQLARGISNKLGRTAAKLGLDMAGEGAEEVFSQIASNLGSSLYKEEDITELLFNEEAMDGYLESFIGGAALGGVSGVFNAVKSSGKGVDYTSGLTENEQKVVDKLYKDEVASREKEGKVTEKEKSKIYDSILRDMEKGYISTDTIEEVLGGDSYSAYKKTVDSEDAILKEYDELGQKTNATLKDQARYAELTEKVKNINSNSQRNTLRSKLNDDVMGLVNGSRLAESYNERSRRGQAYEADLTQYDENQQKVVQKAIDSGILNNTNRTHEFVDIIAKISADKGVLFDFTNNAKLKESGFAVDGKQVNGFVTNDGITLNIDSPKAWQSTVGHEITHVLEGTELYTELQNTLVEYAKSKGDYQGRYDALTELYKDVKDTDINAELTADLVGEYLFADEDFINNLSSQNRNVFQKIYDEIKYLYKVATAGSKEARELEKVKKAFEKAYRETGKSQGDTKYSIGYHAGDLGKAESYFQQGGGRSTGHFGTGTYFVGNKAAIEGYNKRDGKPAPVETVEFDNYNLYKVYRDETGYKLHDSLHEIDRGFSQDYLNAAIKDKFRASELRSEAWKLGEKYEVKEMDEELGFEMTTNFYEAGIRAMTEVAEANNVEFRTYEEHLEYIGEEAKPGDEDYDLYQDEYYDYLKKLLEEADEDRNYGYSRFRDAHWELRMMFGKDNVNRALQAVLDHDAVMENADYDTMSVSDSRATVFMKALGYEGIDVRGTRLDNTTYGSVIYDLKGEDAKRKAEIGTAKYSLSDSDGKQLTKEQQEYFKDSKMRDENGNLKVMYHGSKDAGFHVFDSSMSDDGTSFFFVDRNEVAASYSGTTETYEAKTFNTVEDLENFFEEIGAEGYEIVEENGRLALYHDGDHVVETDDAQGIYEEFCWYEGVGEGDANYKVYLNLKNPLEVDAQGRSWNMVGREFSQELYDKYMTLTDTEKSALVDATKWDDFGTFRDEVNEAVETASNPARYGGYVDDNSKAIASAVNKLRNSKGELDMYTLHYFATENFADDVIREDATVWLKTRDYAQKAKAEGYDGVIFKNIVDVGQYGGDYNPATVAIAFDSNQIKSVANAKPTADPDIRYSLSEVTEEQNQKGLDRKSEVTYSLSNDTAYMDKAIAKNNSMMYVSRPTLEETKAMRERIAARMNAIKDRGLVGLPEDIEGNTYIANSSYDGTEENTTICPRSLASEAFVDAVSEYLGRPLSVQEQIYISQDLQGRSLTPECTYCYVATDRKAYRAFLGEYVAQRDAVLQKVQDNPNADVSRNGELYKQFLNGRKDTNPMYSRFKMWVDAYKNGKPMIDASHLANINKLMGDINSEFGAELKPQIVDAMKYAQSASWAKKRVNYVAYNGHILNWKQDRINKLNSHYGLRMYSFSDFHPAFVLENMQMITDASVRGLKMLGYTKDTDFVDIFAPSGMNINVSTFGFETGGNVFENNLIGAEWEKAKALREQYPNVGITFVATNDTLVDWALNQDWVDVVIPYHLVRTGAEVAKAFNYTNYTSESSDTKTKDWKKGDQKYIAPTEHNNDKATYLAALAKNHLKPRFERFIDNPNYMKLVNECRQPASVSKPVQPVFNEDAAMVALAKLEANGYYQPIGGSVDRMYEIAGEVADAMTNELAPAMSLSNVGEQHTPNSLSSMRLDAPVAENSIVQEETQLKEENATGVTATDMQELFPDDAVPVQEELEQLMNDRDMLYSALEIAVDRGSANDVGKLAEEYEALNARIKALESEDSERTGSFTDSDVPPEMDAPISMKSENYNPYGDITLDEITRKTRTYSDRNSGARQYIEEAALGFLYDVNNSTHGERWYNDDVYYASGGEHGFGGTSRSTTDDIAYLKDSFGYTWEQLQKAAEDVVKGEVRSVAAKRVEFLIHNRLMEGYTDVDGRRYEPNQEYITFLNEAFADEQRAGGFDNLLENADQYAPTLEEFYAPMINSDPRYEKIESAPVFESKDPNVPRGQTTMFAPEKKTAPTGGKTANILTNEPKTPKRRNKFWSLVKEHVFDNGMVFEDLSKRTGNREIEAKWNFIRYSQSRAQRLIGNGTDGVKALKDIKKTVDKSGKTAQFYDYLYHKHNVDRMSLEDRFDNTPNKAVFGDSVTSEMSQKQVEQYERKNPEFLNWAEDVYGYMNHLRNLLVENGVISKETADLWEDMYPHYVPIRRAGQDGLNINVPLDTYRTTINNPVKRATGGNQDILPLFDTMAQRTAQTYRAISRNSFGIELKNQLGSVVDTNVETVDDVIDSIDTDDALLKPGEKGMNPTFTVFEDGERVEFEITEEMYEAMKPKSEALRYRNKILSTASSVFRGLTTQYSIPFMATNAIKDAQDVLINSQHPVKTYANFPRAWYQQLFKGKYYQEYIENGGEDNSYFDNETNAFKEDNWFMKGVKFPLNVISEMNNFIELTPRLSEYIASRDAGRSVEVSMLDAARVTTNFAAGGDATKFLNANGATFLNASVQGAVQQVRNIREAHHKGLMGYVGLATKFALAGLPTVLLNNALWDDDEDYEDLADYVKQDYYVVYKYDDGKFFRIPKGRTVAVIQNAIEQVQNAATGDDEVDLASFLQLAVNNLAPNNPLENNIIAPIIQAATNKTWYGEDLVPSRLQDLPTAEQYDEKTDSFSKKLGETELAQKLGISPYQINYVLNQYSGGIGDLILPMATPRAESGDDSLKGVLTAPLRDKFTTDSVINSQVVTDYYDTKDALAVKANSSKATEDDYFRDLYMDTVGYELSDLYKQKREIQNSDMSDSEKYTKSRELQEQIVERMKQSLSSYDNINASGIYAEVGDKRYNKDADSGKWYEIKPKNADGSDNWYYQKEQEVTKGLGISYEEYWNNREEYNYAYDKPGKYAVAKAVGGFDSYMKHYDVLENWQSDSYLAADKDSQGNSISGSRKNKVIEYINGLDADYGEKIILYRTVYSSKSDKRAYNQEIIDYLNSRDDISYQDMKMILEELDMEVDSEGNITW